MEAIYAYKLLNIILWSAYQNNYIPEKEFPKLKHYPDPQHKSVFLSTEQIRKLLDQASTTSSYLEILLALFLRAFYRRNPGTEIFRPQFQRTYLNYSAALYR